MWLNSYRTMGLYRLTDPTLSCYAIRKPLERVFNITEHKSVNFIKKAICYENKNRVRSFAWTKCTHRDPFGGVKSNRRPMGRETLNSERTSRPHDGVLLVSISCGVVVSLWDWTGSYFLSCVRLLGLQMHGWTHGGHFLPWTFWKREIKIEREVLRRTNRLLSFDMTRTA
jgi:hypothetical protein